MKKQIKLKKESINNEKVKVKKIQSESWYNQKIFEFYGTNVGKDLKHSLNDLKNYENNSKKAQEKLKKL